MPNIERVIELDGTTTDVAYTPEQEQKVQQAKAQALTDIEEGKKQQQDRAAAIAHAKSLGFTDAMIAVMYPNLGGNNG